MLKNDSAKNLIDKILPAVYNSFISLSKLQRALFVAALIVMCIIITILGFVGGDNDSITTEDVTVKRVEMKTTVTAAGEVVAAKSEEIEFSSSKTFEAMCVETNEVIMKNQHIIKYSDGTYEDAPADGVIMAINAPQSGSIGGSSYTVTFAKSKKLALEITVPEGEINNVKKGDDVEIVVNSNTSKTYTGKITSKQAISTTLLSDTSAGTSSDEASVAASQESSNGGASMREGLPNTTTQSPFGSESKTAYYTVTLEFNNDGNILLGMGAICTITISDRDDVMSVPVEAVEFDDEGNAYVVVVKGTSTENVKVEVGDSDANYVEITKGLDGDETVRISRKG